MFYDLILKNGTLVTPENTFLGDIAVKDGKIAKTGHLDDSDSADEVYDAKGLHILPGIIDAHVHFRDPGLTEKEDFETGSIAAAFGGITTVADMPNVIPVTSTAQRFSEKLAIAKEKSYIDFGLFALLTNENTGEMEALKKAGAFGFKIFFGTSTGDIACPAAGTMIEQMLAASHMGSRIGFHAETSELNLHFTSLCKNTEGSSTQGILLSNSRPVISEVLAIQNILCYAQYTNAKVHIHHVTCDDGSIAISQAKEKGINVTSETCPHYLLLDANKDVQRVYPPIRDKAHSKNLVFDMIASDHAPHTAKEKSLPLWEMPAGLSGVETLVPLMLNEVNKGSLTLNDFVRLASQAPAQIWGIYPQKGNLNPGADADFTIVDMNKKSKIDKEKLHSKSKTSAWDGTEVKGMPVATIVRGKFIVKHGKLTGSKGYGELVSSIN